MKFTTLFTLQFRGAWLWVLFAAVFVSSRNAPPQQTATNGYSHSHHIPFQIWANNSFGSILCNYFAPNNPLTSCPIIARILSYGAICLVAYISFFEQTDLKFVSICYLSRPLKAVILFVAVPMIFLRNAYAFIWPCLVCVYMRQDWWTMLIMW